MSSGGAAKPSQPQVSIAQLGVHVAEQSQPQVSIPQLGVSVAEQSQPQSSIAQLGVSVAKQSQPQVSIPQLGVSVAFLLEFTEKHQKFDRFTINRHGTNNVQARSGSLRSKANVKRIGHIVLVQSLWTNPVPLTRAWCLWEILCTFRTKSTFEIILPPKEEKSLLESPVTQEGFNSINTMLATVDVANAKAWKAEDQKKILKAVAKTGEGIHGLNKVVVEQLRDWLANAKAAIPEEPSSKDALSLIRGVAILMSNQGTLAPSGSSASVPVLFKLRRSSASASFSNKCASAFQTELLISKSTNVALIHKCG
eukprot:g8799.t1